MELCYGSSYSLKKWGDCMSILIKGMEMPTERERFNLTIKYNGTVLDTETGMQVAEAHELPPHGRLIDADALMLKILDYIEEYSDVDEKGWHNLKWCAMKEAEMAINNAPTIIEAEEGE